MENITKNKVKLEKKDLNKGFWSWQFWAMSSLSWENLEGNGFALGMLPIADKLYERGTKEHAEMLARHSVFYNTEPQTGALICGIVASMEEGKANGDPVDESAIHTVKSALMGPLAGIGDSVVQGIFVPLLLSIAMGISSTGSPVGVILYIVVYMGFMLTFDHWLYLSGYKLGVNSIDMFIGEKSNSVRSALTVLGVMVAGGLATSFVHLTTILQIYNAVTDQYFVVQDALDGFFPGLLGFLSVLFAYWLINKKKFSSNKVLLILIGVAVVGVLVGIF